MPTGRNFRYNMVSMFARTTNASSMPPPTPCRSSITSSSSKKCPSCSGSSVRVHAMPKYFASVATCTTLLGASLSDAWVAVVPRINKNMGNALYRNPPRHHAGTVGLRPFLPPRDESRQQQLKVAGGATGSVHVVQCGAGVDDKEGRTGADADPQRPSDRGAARHLHGVAGTYAGRGWQQDFASLLNDAGDPWTAQSWQGDENNPQQQCQLNGGDVPEMATAAAATAEPQRAGGQQPSLGATFAAASTSTSTSSSRGASKPRPDVVGTTNNICSEKRDDQSEGESSSPSEVAAAAVQDAAAAAASATTIHSEAVASTTLSVVTQAAELMASRGESDSATAYRAYLLLDAELSAARGEGHASATTTASATATALSCLTQWTAAALLSWIRCETAGNGLIVADDGQVGTSDTTERQKLWAEHAPRVLQLVKEVGKDPALDPELQQIFTEAVMYSVSSQGILEAFVTGKAFAFTSAVGTLMNKYPAQDNGVAFIFQGSYFLAAPWPIRSPKKALENYDKAVKVNGRSRRNVYYAGLGRLACGDRKGSAEMFRRAVSDELCESASTVERDIAVELRKQSQRGLDLFL